MNLKAYLRRAARVILDHAPQLGRIRGTGLGQWLSSGQQAERILIDGDIQLEIDLSIVTCRALYFVPGEICAEEIALFKRVLSPQDGVVDVGANFGYVSLIAAKYAGRVIACEPSAETQKALAHNLALNPTLQAKINNLRMGLSDKPGTLTLFRPTSRPGEASLRAVGRPDEQAEVVPMDTLDHVCGNQRIRLIKIDVEGAELDVLRGGLNTLRSSQPHILIELFEPHQKRFNRSVADIVTYLTDLGYAGRLIAGVQHGMLKFEPLVMDELVSCQEIRNALFVRREDESIFAQP